MPKSAQDLVATLVRSIFAQPDGGAVWAQHGRVVEQLTERFPEAVALLAEAASEVYAFGSFPKDQGRQIWWNNPQERLNREVRRRTDVVGIFPNRAAVIHLVGAVHPCRATRRVCGGAKPPQRGIRAQGARRRHHIRGGYAGAGGSQLK